jgi:DNA-binding response OmpR family regulator
MKILLIEDEEVIHESLIDNLTYEGYEIDSAYDGYSGLNLALKRSYDLIILDLMLPKIEGMEILKKIRQKHIDVPVIILSAKTEEFTKLEGFREGADDYVCKPFSLPELLARIKVITKRRVAQTVVNSFVFGKGTFDFNSYMLKSKKKKKNVQSTKF